MDKTISGSDNTIWLDPIPDHMLREICNKLREWEFRKWEEGKLRNVVIFEFSMWIPPKQNEHDRYIIGYKHECNDDLTYEEIMVVSKLVVFRLYSKNWKRTSEFIRILQESRGVIYGNTIQIDK